MDHPLEKPAGSPVSQTGPPPDPEYEAPTAAAEVFWHLQTGEEHAVEATKSTTGQESPEKRRLYRPLTARMGIKVPADASDRLLTTVENVTLGFTWSGTVLGTLFGAGAAHLPPAGTLTVVVLEVLGPPVLFFRRRKSRQPDSTER
jgi:hypothetical protein